MKHGDPKPDEGLFDGASADAIAAGGGLAGSAFALELARHGASAMIFERMPGPHHKVCGEFLSDRAQALFITSVSMSKPSAAVLWRHYAFQTARSRLVRLCPLKPSAFLGFFLMKRYSRRPSTLAQGSFAVCRSMGLKIGAVACSFGRRVQLSNAVRPPLQAASTTFVVCRGLTDQWSASKFTYDLRKRRAVR